MGAVPTTLNSKRDRPPPIPPKPNQLQGSKQKILGNDYHQQNFTKEQNYDTVDHRKLLTEPQPIGELVRQCHSQLPQCFSISESMYGICEDRSLMEGQLLSVHFQKTMRVLSVKASQSGSEYTLPVSSSLGVSLLYNPDNKPDKSKRGYEFKEVVDLINADPLPQMICVLESFTDLNNRTLKEGEILFINKIKKVDESLCLVCTNVLTGESSLIGKTCATRFTTATDKIAMSLSKLLNYVKLPANVVFSSPPDGSIVLPSSALGGYYTIEQEREEKSVIASTKYMSEEDSSVETIEILLSLPLDVQLVELSSEDLEKLRIETQQLYDNFHFSHVNKVICDLESSINYIQTALFKALGGGPSGEDWKTGMSFQAPKRPGLQSELFHDDEYEDMELFNLVSSSKQLLVGEKIGHLPNTPPPAAQTLPRLPPRKDSSEPPTSTQRHRHPLPIPATASPSSIKSIKSDSLPEIQPYLIARQHEGDSELQHEKPYDYVKFSKGRDLELESLKKELTALKKENSKLYDSLGGVAKGIIIIMLNLLYYPKCIKAIRMTFSEVVSLLIAQPAWKISF